MLTGRFALPKRRPPRAQIGASDSAVLSISDRPELACRLTRSGRVMVVLIGIEIPGLSLYLIISPVCIAGA
jgi:hypothetical protein